MIDALIVFVAENKKEVGETLGFIAGMVVLASGLPSLKEQLLVPYAGTRAQRNGHLLLALGNALWVASALFTGAFAISVMAGLNVVIRISIWARMTCERWKPAPADS